MKSKSAEKMREAGAAVLEGQTLCGIAKQARVSEK